MYFCNIPVFMSRDIENDNASLVKIWLRWFKKKCLYDQKRRFSEYSVVNHLNILRKAILIFCCHRHPLAIIWICGKLQFWDAGGPIQFFFCFHLESPALAKIPQYWKTDGILSFSLFKNNVPKYNWSIWKFAAFQ